MINESITFDKLPQAVSYLTEQVIELKQMVSALQPTSSANVSGSAFIPCICFQILR